MRDEATAPRAGGDEANSGGDPGTDPAPAVGQGLTADFRRIETEAVERPFPAEVLNEYRVHIDPAAYQRMHQHAALSDEVELCGVLVGVVAKDDQGHYLRVDAVIEGEGANMHGAQVTFTHQTWSHINRVMDEQHPGKRIVGWYHTHPGFGVFLSGMDGFIQENFFNQPYQVAIVIETHAKEEGCFAWVEGKPTPLRRFWVGNAGDLRPASGRHATGPGGAPAPAVESGRAAGRTAGRARAVEGTAGQYVPPPPRRDAPGRPAGDGGGPRAPRSEHGPEPGPDHHSAHRPGGEPTCADCLLECDGCGLTLSINRLTKVVRDGERRFLCAKCNG